jgi:glycosyltransferase involved in cell wall biosynthesis
MAKRKVLFIGLVWPEPTSSAAGTRIIQLVNLFLAKGDEVHFASAAQKSTYSFPLKKLGVEEHSIQLNESGFDLWIKELNPNIIVFDRFMIEEQFGWRVQQECPNTLRILDTEDLHFLRKVREKQYKKNLELNKDDLFSDEAKREIAAILRCDLSLMISEEEIKILTEQFKIDPRLLYYLPFLEDEISVTEIERWPKFSERQDFVFIGNFIHEPNWQTVLTLKKEIWPRLRKLLPSAKMNVFGAYAPQKALQLNSAKDGFLVHGRAEDARATIAKHKILLAPITFGAGAKGKLVDAMQAGTPSVTTPMGAEAMKGELEWNGAVTDDWDIFCEQATLLYQNEDSWQKAQQNGVIINNEKYCKHKFDKQFGDAIDLLLSTLKQHRENNFIGEILKHHHLQSTKYMSLWIEEKNRK